MIKNKKASFNFSPGTQQEQQGRTL